MLPIPTQVALVETGNVGVEVATEWLFSAPESTQFEHYTSGAQLAQPRGVQSAVWECSCGGAVGDSR
jgi:hypothetical protein